MSSPTPGAVPDSRFSLANEHTYRAWLRTAVALVVGGLVAAKVGSFHHEAWRWAVSAPSIAAGAVVAIHARRRWAAYEAAMRRRQPLPTGRGFGLLAVCVAAYACVVLAAALLDA